MVVYFLAGLTKIKVTEELSALLGMALFRMRTLATSIWETNKYGVKIFGFDLYYFGSAFGKWERMGI